jgi:hypothetical protein
VTRALIAVSLLALAVCQPAPEPEPAGEVRIAVGPITSASELAGYYRIGGIKDVELGDEGFPVQITEDRVMVLARCVRTEWIYRFEGERIAVTAEDQREPCRRALNPDERAIVYAFGGMERATRTPANGILIEGTGPAITLFSQ